MSVIDRRSLLAASGAGLVLSATTHSAGAQDKSPSTPMPSVATFARSPIVDEIALSPDGKRVAIMTQNGDDKILIDFTVADQKPRRLNLGPHKVRDLFWADNGHVVVVTSSTAALPNFVGGKHEFEMARNIDIESARVVTLFSGQEGFYPIVLGNLQRAKIKGEYRLLASSPRMGSNYFDLCLLNFKLDTPHGNVVTEGTYMTQAWVIAPDGYLAAYSDFDDENKIWELYINQSGRDKMANFTVVYKIKNALNAPDLLGLGRDGKSVLVYINDGTAGGQYHEIGPDGKLSEPIDPEGEGKPRSPLFHPTTGHLAGFLRHDDWFTYDYFDTMMKTLGEAVSKVMDGGYRSSVASYAEDPRQMIIYGESAYDAGSYFFNDFATGQNIIIANNYPDLPEEWITEKQTIIYKAADGLEIHAYLTLPPFKVDKNLPLVVLPHGGPQVRDYIDFDWQAQTFASRGYAVLQPNFRGSDGYGEDFVNAGHGEWGRKMQTDLSDGVRYLAGKGIIDPKRVAIFGASYGGYAALAGATIDTGIYTCAVSIAGVSDFKGMLEFERANSVTADASRMLYWKQFMGDARGYDEVSPYGQAEKASCPVLLIHGTDDTVVPIDQSQRMERALKAAGKPVEFITYKGQDHWETISSTRVAMMQAAVDFITKYNPA